MKNKVGFFSNDLLQTFFYKDFANISAIVFFLLIFCEDVQHIIGLTSVASLGLLYTYRWKQANKLQNISITINGCNVEVCEGDLFQQQDFKVIAFNEYFDTAVDNNVVYSNTINGTYIQNYVADVNKLNQDIAVSLKDRIAYNNPAKRTGNKSAYKLGTMFKRDDFFLTAFSHFNDTDKSHLSMTDYISCLMEMWNEIEKNYNKQSVSLPIMGAGVTHFKGKKLSEQELLEIILWTLKLSNIQLVDPAKIKIIVPPSTMGKINLYKLQQEYS